MNTYEKGARAMFGALVLSTAACAPNTENANDRLNARYTLLYEAEKDARNVLDDCEEFNREYPEASGCAREQRELDNISSRRDELSLAMNIVRRN